MADMFLFITESSNFHTIQLSNKETVTMTKIFSNLNDIQAFYEYFVGSIFGTLC